MKNGDQVPNRNFSKIPTTAESHHSSRKRDMNNIVRPFAWGFMSDRRIHRGYFPSYLEKNVLKVVGSEIWLLESEFGIDHWLDTEFENLEGGFSRILEFGSIIAINKKRCSLYVQNCIFNFLDSWIFVRILPILAVAKETRRSGRPTVANVGQGHWWKLDHFLAWIPRFEKKTA